MRVSRSTAVVAVTLLATLAGCGTQSGDPDESATATSTDSTPAPDGGSDSASDDAPVSDADDAYVVAEPGPRTGPVTVADILVQDTEPLTDDVVTQIQDLAGVSSMDRLSLAQVPIENKLYTVAAVDPATYRAFTVAASADLQEQWDRVADGQLAISPDLAKKLPVDDDGYLELTLDDQTRRVHVGAWAPQVTGVDMVVNDKVGAALGMPTDNALVLSTGETSPSTLRRPLTRLLGADIPVQALDVVAREGLDPNAFQSAVLVGSLADAVGVFNYTPIGGGRIAPDPSWVSSHISTEVVPILGSVTCNKAIFPQLRAALAEVIQQRLESEIHPGEYAGCYYPRFIAGTTSLSNHSFGTALDLNTPGNQRGTVGEMDRGVVAIFKRWGFAWGGDWRYTDPMHFELDRIVRPG